MPFYFRNSVNGGIFIVEERVKAVVILITVHQ